MSETKTLCFTKLGPGEGLGLAFVAGAGGISATAVSLLLVLFARNIYRNYHFSGQNGQRFQVFRTHVDAYFLSLLISDLVQSVGALLNARWARLGIVHCGRFCDAQGACKQLGETGVALATMIIACHTFFVIFFHWTPPKNNIFSAIIIGCIWLFLILSLALGSSLNDQFYTPIPFWCWIGDNFTTLRIVAEYLWLWTAAFLSLLFYPLLFFRLRGNIVVDPENWTRISFHIHRRSPAENLANTSSSFVHLPLPHLPTPSPLPTGGYSASPVLDSIGVPGVSGRYNQVSPQTLPQERVARSEEAKQAMAMLGYPICYIVLVLPLSVTRWTSFVGSAQASFGATAVTLFLFGLSGAVNVALFMYTRPNLLLFGRRQTNAGINSRERRNTREEARPAGSADAYHQGFAFAGRAADGEPRTSSPLDTPFSSPTPLRRTRSRDTAGYSSSDDDTKAQTPSSSLKAGSYRRESRSLRSGKMQQATLEEENGIDAATGRVIPLATSSPSFPLLPLREKSRTGSNPTHHSLDFGESLKSTSFSQPTAVNKDGEDDKQKGMGKEAEDNHGVNLESRLKGDIPVGSTDGVESHQPDLGTRHDDTGEDHG